MKNSLQALPFAALAALSLVPGAAAAGNFPGSVPSVYAMASFVDAKGTSRPIEITQVSTDKRDHDWLSVSYPPAPDKRIRVMLVRASHDMGGGENWVSGVEDVLAQALLNTNRFTLVESGRVDYKIGVSIQGGGTSASGGTVDVGSLLGRGGGLLGVGLHRSKSKLDMTVRVIDGKSGEVEWMQNVSGSASGGGVGVSGIGIGAKQLGEGGAFTGKSPSLAAAAVVCANKAAFLLANQLATGH